MTDCKKAIQLAKQGDRVTLNRLLYDCSEQLSRFIQHRLPSSIRSLVAVEDIRQETFRMAFRKIGEYEDRHEGAFFGWLRTIALNQIRDVIKAQQAKKRGGDVARFHAGQGFADESIANLFDGIAGDDATASRNVAREEAIHFIRVALSGLPDEYRIVLRMQFEEGLTYEQIGEKIGKSTSAVKGLLQRAKTKLQSDLGNASAYLSNG